jgi:hypothetical protein
VEVEVNWLAIVLATLSSLVVGAVWYSPALFANTWMKLAKLTPKTAASPAVAIPTATVVAFLTAYVLAHVTFVMHEFYGHASFLGDALTTAFWLWLGFTAARIITHDTFEKRPKMLTWLALGHELVTVMVMALIIGLMKP